MYNRQALKQRAKRLIGWGNPAMFLITLVYVLAQRGSARCPLWRCPIR